MTMPALRILPHGLTALRLALAPVLYQLILAGEGDLAVIGLAIAMATDAADGPLARRFGVASRTGAHFDFWADFVLIEAVFAGFAATGTGPWAIPVLTALSFGLFVATIRLTPDIYDPLGRNIGGILMGSAFAVLALRDLMVAQAAYLVVLGALVMTLGARTIFIAGVWLATAQTLRTSTPGNGLPSIHSRKAPPAVDT